MGHRLCDEFIAPLNGHHPNDVDDLVGHLRPLEESHYKFAAHPLHSNASTFAGPAVQRECIHFEKGKCECGDKCKFLHTKQQNGNHHDTGRASKNCTKEQLVKMKTQDCRLHLKGKCHHGDKCKFRHDAGKLQAVGGAPVGLSSHTCEESADAPRQNVEASLLQVNSQALPRLIRGSEQRHCDRDPSLRSRKKVKCFLQADDGAVAALGLIDDGAQPTTISEALCQKSKSAGVKFGHRPMVGEVGGLNSSIENEILREVDFAVQIKKHERHGARVRLRICALALSGPVSQDFALGIGTLNMNGINSV
ncbi:MAG: zinc finger CCCH domain-containing protein, partial [Myxococcota bacterium]